MKDDFERMFKDHLTSGVSNITVMWSHRKNCYHVMSTNWKTKDMRDGWGDTLHEAMKSLLSDKDDLEDLLN